MKRKGKPMIQSPIAAVLGSNPASQIMILVHYKATVSSKDTEGDLSLKFIQCKARLRHATAFHAYPLPLQTSKTEYRQNIFC